jgi:fused signal recognition particle receptor
VVVLVVGTAAYLVPRRRSAPPVERPAARPVERPAEAPAEVVTEPVPAEPVPAEVAAPEAAAAELETPAPVAGRLTRLRSRLARSQSTLGLGLLGLLSRERLDDEAWEEIEYALLQADVGVAATTEIVQRLRTQTKVEGTRGEAELRAMLAAELVAALGADTDRSLRTAPHEDGRPAVLLVVGVNGTG